MIDGLPASSCNILNQAPYVTQGLSPEKQKQFVEALKPVFYRAREKFKQINQKLAEANEMMNQAEALKARSVELKEQSVALKQQSDALKAQTEASQIAHEQAMNARKRALAAKVFHLIFHREPPSPQQVDQIFSNYLSNESISVNFQGGYSHINSMAPFIKYLKDNPNITRCNFLHFQNHINEIKSLADYLSEPSCKVTTIAFHASISATDQEILKSAEKTRAGLNIIIKNPEKA